MYICKDGKHNIKNTTHKAENCWAKHSELCLPPLIHYKRKTSDAETHQTGMEAPLTNDRTPPTNSLNLVINCGTTHSCLTTGVFLPISLKVTKASLQAIF
ncbi:hypothetical protein O181_109822 [Austropuccinia psidii MF-1]|uniref:Uncharacterized protein n=1 Tax=Austropuccinia psidii MF-1 TaxID=1389203 RepID=A0A9Q3JYL0_9BASI|nr:hypothetical protein [Austropuccinia psidii MF-1]